MIRLPGLPLAFALALAAACTPPAPPSGPAPAGPVETGGAGPLVSSLQIEAAADSVRFVLQVTNATQAPLALHFRSGQTHDFQVRDGGRVLWTWSADKLFAQAARTDTLAPGGTRSYEGVWHPQAGAAGRPLTGTGRLLAANHPVERSSPFRVP